jgi:hypothetical protein
MVKSIHANEKRVKKEKKKKKRESDNNRYKVAEKKYV